MAGKGLKPGLHPVIASLSALFILLTILQFGYRIIFFLFTTNYYSGIPGTTVLNAFIVGLRFDLQLSALFVLILSLPILLLPLLKAGNNIYVSYFRSVTVMISMVFIVFLITDLYYFQYLSSRLDASILGLMKDTLISFHMLSETYNLPMLLLIAAFCAFILYRISTRLYSISKYSVTSSRKTLLLQSAVLVPVLLAFTWGRISGYALQWSNAHFSAYANANQLAVNPVTNFIMTLNWAGEGYNEAACRQCETMNFFSPYSGNDHSSEGFRMYGEGNNDPPVNLVIIFMETFPAYKCGALGNPMDPTPNFDRIAGSGELYTHFYVPKVSTAASIFSLLTSLPDLAVTNKSSTRNPMLIRQQIPINDLENHERYFFVGGSANWGEMNGFLKANIDGIHIVDETVLRSPRVNAWGVSDYDMFMESLNYLDDVEKPFAAIYLTGSNHSPFTLPEQLPDGFELTEWNNDWKDAGFSGEAKLNTFRFMDHSLGAFYDAVKQKEYFDRTVFIILGDHGESIPGQDSDKSGINEQFHHVAMAVAGPGFSPGKIENYVSEIDILPAVMNRLGFSFRSNGLEKEIYSQDPEQYAFFFNSSLKKVGMFYPGGILTQSTAAEIEDLKSRSDNPLELLTKCLYETARKRRFSAGITDREQH